MTTFMLFIGLLCNLGLLIYLLLYIRTLKDERAIRSAIKQDLAEHQAYLMNTLQTTSADTAERISRTSGNLRQEIADRITEELLHIQERIDAQLTRGRKESRYMLAKTTQSLEGKFGHLEAKTQEQLELMREKVDDRLTSIGQHVQAKLDENMQEGFKHFEKVQEHLKAAEMQLQTVGTVGTSINELNSLLKLPHLRGGFGEATLERLLQDFLPAHLFELQCPIDGVGRVDVLVKFPKATLPIDSKFPREQILNLFETSDPKKLTEARQALRKVLRLEAKRISKYIRPDHGTMEMAVMFLPSEILYFEVIRDNTLWEDLGKLQIFPASPNTLAIMLRGIAIAHDYYEMAASVEKTIENLQKAQRHFAHFEKKFEAIGRGLENAREAYQVANTHLNRYSGSVIRLTGRQAETPRNSTPQNGNNGQEPLF
ncbi:DNA recombination protein RmuC [candidate division KSB3 bacterium]|uniref:DNA recombination protein RmuC n=1 Tax=candidate division KSB3 bacterium TaxID=2044937 RepID=A0A9D5JXT0_9BACT|nr:DNA recombination protein RmuC [candidate division KSB3 bacterium]MBD3325661.1 DNA recombination protein RmuC [candidate division KSB3 bacterium]